MQASTVNITFDETNDDERFNIYHYKSMYFIIWYCFLMFCFLSSMCFIGFAYCRYITRISGVNLDEIDDSTTRREREADSWDLVRIQENVNTFSKRMMKGKKRRLLKALSSNEVVITKENFCSNDVHLSNNRLADETVTDIENGENQIKIRRVFENCTESATKKYETELQVPSSCAICLDNFKSGEAIVASVSPNCPDVFHKECILKWLVAKDDVLCPCCRQVFVHEEQSSYPHMTQNASSSNSPRNEWHDVAIAIE